MISSMNTLDNATKAAIDPLSNSPGALFLHLSTRPSWMTANRLAETHTHYGISPLIPSEGKLSYFAW